MYRVKDDNRSNYRGRDRKMDREEDKRGINCSAVGEKEGCIE